MPSPWDPVVPIPPPPPQEPGSDGWDMLEDYQIGKDVQAKGI